MSESIREQSRQNFTTDQKTMEALNTGALLRIADATEKMCLDREKLERNYEHMRNNRNYYRDRAEQLKRSNAALRGVITKLKKRIDAPRAREEV